MTDPDAIEIDILYQTSSDKKRFSLNAALYIPSTGVTAIFGASGSGKTTLLRCIAGLESDLTGTIKVSGRPWLDTKINVPSHKRPVGFVFQDAVLFEHLSVEGNLQFALKRSENPDNTALYHQVVSLLDIKKLLTRSTPSLSGGEKQRVAIARALLIQPKLLLMDEPLASLGQSHKNEILPYLESLAEHFSIPVIYVTHDMQEVLRLAQHIVLLEDGKVQASGSIEQVLSTPHLAQKADIEVGSIISGKVLDIDPQWKLASVDCDDFKLNLSQHGLTTAAIVKLRILARDVSISTQPTSHSSILNRVPCRIAAIEDDADPAMAVIELKAGTTALLARITKKSLHELSLTLDQAVFAHIKSAAILY